MTKDKRHHFVLLCEVKQKNINEKPSQQKKIVIFKNTDFFEHQNHYQI